MLRSISPTASASATQNIAFGPFAKLLARTLFLNVVQATSLAIAVTSMSALRFTVRKIIVKARHLEKI